MPSDHTARSILDAFYRAETKYLQTPEPERDFGVIGAVIGPTCKLYQSSGLPYAGTYDGPEGMEEWVRQMALYFDRLEVQNPQIFEQAGSSQVMVLSTLYLRVRKSGQELSYPFAQAFTMDLEAGTIVEVRPFYWDIHDLNAAVGHSPKST